MNGYHHNTEQVKSGRHNYFPYWAGMVCAHNHPAPYDYTTSKTNLSGKTSTRLTTNHPLVARLMMVWLKRRSITRRLFVVATSAVWFPSTLRDWFWSWFYTHIQYVFSRTDTSGIRSQPDKPALLPGDLCHVPVFKSFYHLIG